MNLGLPEAKYNMFALCFILRQRTRHVGQLGLCSLCEKGVAVIGRLRCREACLTPVLCPKPDTDLSYSALSGRYMQHCIGTAISSSPLAMSAVAITPLSLSLLAESKRCTSWMEGCTWPPCASSQERRAAVIGVISYLFKKIQELVRRKICQV